MRLLVLTLLCAGLAACRETHDLLWAADAGAPSDGRPNGDGPPTTSGPATAISSGRYHTCAIAGGALYCWGANDEGRLGLGDTERRLSPARVGTADDWQAVAAGERSTVALKRDGSLWAWGANDVGQLGLGAGDFSARRAPVRVGDRTDWTTIACRFLHACAIASDRTAWCWGSNQEGQLARSDQDDVPVPTRVNDDHDWTAVDPGQGHTCGIHADGTLECWGRNSEAELGQGSSDPLQIRQPIQVGDDTDWQVVQSGQSGTCGLRGGVVHCWGLNIDEDVIPGAVGQNVVGAPLAISAPVTPTRLSFNTFGGCVLSAAGDAYCWGRNDEGQLGLGDTDDRRALTALPQTGWTHISVGRFNTCGVRSGAVACTGDNRSGQLGTGDQVRRNTMETVPLP